MADTGAPWNIPYAEPSDLVRDWPALSEDVAEAVADGLDEASLIKQVVQTVKTDTFTANPAIGAETSDVTGLTVSITPSTNTNKVLVRGVVNISTEQTVGSIVTLYRGGTVVSGAVGDLDGSRPQGTSGGSTSDGSSYSSVSFEFLDSPATTSATVYSVRLRHTSNAGNRRLAVNQTDNNNNDSRGTRLASTLTAIEVSA
jgi:hypothetical protein